MFVLYNYHCDFLASHSKIFYSRDIKYTHTQAHDTDVSAHFVLNDWHKLLYNMYLPIMHLYVYSRFPKL